VSKALTASARRKRDKRGHVDQTFLHELHSGGEFVVEAERAFQDDLFGGHGLHRQGHVTAQSKLHKDALRA
jgi:hypothetical protein